MLVLYPVPTSVNAGPDLCTLRLRCFNCANIPLVYAGGDCHQFQLALVVLFICPLHKLSTSTHGGIHQSLQLALVVLFLPATGANAALALRQPALCGGGHCMMVVVVCGGGGIHI